MPSEPSGDSMEAAGLQHQLQDAAAGLPEAETAGVPDDAEEDDDTPGVIPGLRLKAEPAGDHQGSMQMVRAMHRRNLVGLLSRALQEGDYMTGAGTAGALLKALPRGSERVKESAPTGGRNVVRMVHVLWGTVEVLLQNMAPAEQVKKVLIRMADLFKQTQSLKRAAHVELLMHTWKHSTPADVQALISQPETATYLAGAGSMGPFAYQVAWISALIQHRAWFQQVLALHASSIHSQQQHLSTASLLGPLQLPFVPPSSLVSQSGRVQDGSGSQQDVAAGTEGDAEHPAAAVGGGGEGGVDSAVGNAAVNLELALKKVLSISPGASQPALLMCHMLMLSGRQADAVQVATAAAAASGMSPESLSLWALLTEQQALATVAAAPPAPAARAVDAAATAAAPLEDADVDMEADDDVHAGVDPVHSFVTVCEEILRTDPWALGALEGLLQTPSHCHSCTAAAIRGLIVHMDAALTEAAAGDMHTYVACDTSSAAVTSNVSICLHLQQQLCHWWVVLAGLLVQLATAAAAADQLASGGPAQPQNQAQLPRAQQQQQQQQQQQRHGSRDSDSFGEAEEQAPEEAAADAVGGVQCPWALWQQLQQQWFAARRQWWPLAGLCQPQEVTLLTHLVQQLQQRHAQQQQKQQQHQHQGSPVPEGTPQQQQQHNLTSQNTGPVTGNGLLGSAGGPRGWGGGLSGGSLGAGASGGLRILPSQYHLPSTQQRLQQFSDADRDSDSQQGSQEGNQGDVDLLVGHQQQQQQLEGRVGLQQEREQGIEGQATEGVRVDDVCQAIAMLCSKAVVLGFVLGPTNSYSTAVGATLAATAAHTSTAAATVAVQPQSQTDAIGGCVELASAADEARLALQDALQLTRQVQERLAEQQQRQRQSQQQQQQQQPKRHFGVPTAEFGALLDMPDTWWAAFPHKRRTMRQQQQQQQQQQDSEDADMG